MPNWRGQEIRREIFLRKLVILVFVLVLLLGVAPWGIGKVAEARVNAGLDRLIQEAPYLSIVERKWTSGWFRSEQEVTFEVFGPWMRAMKPATVLADIKKAEEAAAASRATRQLEALPPEETVDVAAADDAGTSDESGAATGEAPADDAKPLRFTVRNEILHGPLLWPASLGFARVNTKLVMNDEIRKGLMETFGTDEPVKLSSRVGFFGDGSTRFYGDGRTVKFKGEPGELKYDDFEFEIGYSKNLDDVDAEGSWPKIEFSNSVTGERLLVNEMSIVGEGERVVGDLYNSDYKFAIAGIRFIDAADQEISVDDIHYAVVSSVDKGFMDVGAKLGSGKIRTPALTELKFEVDEAHYDFSLRRLHAETLEKLITSIKLAYTRPVATAADVEAALITPFREHGIALLKYDPEFVIERIGIVTPEGEGYIKGVIHLKGVTDADFPDGSFGRLISKVEADLTLEIAQKLVEKLPGGATGAGLAVEQGVARREGEKLVSHIEFRNKELNINGKPHPIPGLGQEPPADQMRMDSEAPPYSEEAPEEE
jgi:uncharacterized protein YdgA (DUF945 family)